MHRNRIILMVLLTLMQISCVNAPLIKRIDLLEKQLADQRRNTHKIETRMDELQIQLTLIARKIDQKTASADQPHQVPSLSIYKLAPKPVQPDMGGAHTRSPGLADKKNKHNKNKRIMPNTGNHGLAVDHPAAKRPVLPATAAPSREFEKAFNLFRSNELQKAIAALNRFAKNHPQHTMTQDALYYAAKAHMMLGKTKLAEKRFLELAKIHPQYTLSAEALLLAGTCQERLGRKQEARSTYLQLVDAYPLSDPASEANRRLKAIR